MTGANGFIGKAVVRELIERNFEIIPVVRTASGQKNEIVLDFCDQNFYHAIYSLPRADVIVHLGARVGLNGATRPELFMPNVVATAVLADWARRNGTYFIFSSTAIVCGSKNPLISAASMSSPDTEYGYSKWLAEEMIRMSGIKHAILRISGVFGKDGPRHLGINMAIDNARKGIVPTQYGKGEIKRNYIYVKDLCEVVISCIENGIEGIHLVAGSIINTVAEMLNIICANFFPGKKPECHEGSAGKDQIIEHSKALPHGRLFEDAIKDIVKNAGKTFV